MKNLKSKKCLAIIPARGGSKRIPQKNMKEFLGQPIIKYSIDAAIKSNCFDEIMVSTDDKKIADVARQYGAKVPFFRSKEASNDFAGLADVIYEVLKEYEKNGKTFSYCCCILATAPFLSEDILIKSFNLLLTTGSSAVIPVTKFSYPIQRSLKIKNGKLEMIWPENLNVRSQDLDEAYHDVGQFYWIMVDSFLKEKTVFLMNSVPFLIPEELVQDIDTLKDWEMAELKYKLIKKTEIEI